MVFGGALFEGIIEAGMTFLPLQRFLCTSIVEFPLKLNSNGKILV